MLKLERNRTNNDLYLTLRSQERFFNASFCKAFAFACLLHILPLSLFHIHRFYSEPFYLFPPAFVSLPPIENHHVILDITDPSMTLLPLTPAPLTPTLTQVSHLTPTTFFNVQEYIHHTPPPSLSYHPIQIAISGPLARRSLSNVTQETRLTTKTLKTFHSKYRVYIDDKTGKIIWFEPASPAPEIRHLTENVIHTLEFSTDPNFEDLYGLVDIWITQEIN